MTQESSERGLAAESFFDSEALRYDSAYDATGARGRIVRGRMAATLGVLGGGPGEVLDAGMGGGRLCVELDRGGWTVSGIDASRRMVELARARIPDRADRLRKASIEDIPFPDGSFDAVTATGVLEYAGDLRTAIGELARVLRPGGRAVVSFPHYRSPAALWRSNVVYPIARRVNPAVGRRAAPPAPPRAVPVEEVRTLLEAAGLRVASRCLLGGRGPAALAPLTASQYLLVARKVEGDAA